MISRVLVAMDDSELAERALEYALEVFPDAEITVLHVVGTPSGMMGGAMSLAMSDDLDQEAHERAQPIHERAGEIAADHDAEILTAVEVGPPARAIVSRAADYDQVVVGSHGSSITDRLFVGNVSETVFKRSPVPVTVVR